MNVTALCMCTLGENDLEEFEVKPSYAAVLAVYHILGVKEFDL